MENNLYLPKLQIWVTRHGQTEGNIQKIVQGHTDGKLTQKGKEQVINLIKKG